MNPIRKPCMPSPSFTLSRNPHGRLCLSLPGEDLQEGVTPVRSYPISAPLEGLSLMGQDGRELLWIEHLDQVPAAERALLDEELASREFVPTIERIVEVSSFSMPSTWSLETDRGPVAMVLKAEEDIRKIEGRKRLLITSRDGVQYRIPDSSRLDKASLKLLDRFL